MRCDLRPLSQQATHPAAARRRRRRRAPPPPPRACSQARRGSAPLDRPQANDGEQWADASWSGSNKCAFTGVHCNGAGQVESLIRWRWPGAVEWPRQGADARVLRLLSGAAHGIVRGQPWAPLDPRRGVRPQPGAVELQRAQSPIQKLPESVFAKNKGLVRPSSSRESRRASRRPVAVASPRGLQPSPSPASCFLPPQRRLRPRVALNLGSGRCTSQTASSG